jgi:hypothetical protein
MLQGWNKFCFIGGIIEFRAKLPGSGNTGGLWPARKYFCYKSKRFVPLLAHSVRPLLVWMLGNLARATYIGSTDFVWPFSYSQCDKRTRLSQEINACAQVNHYGLQGFEGRGSPEIDVIEAMQGDKSKLPNTKVKRPYQSCSLQVAPGIEIDRPELGHRPQKVCVALVFVHCF